jgi:hypothetical protein
MTPATALAAPIAQFATWHLSVHCDHCRFIRQLDVKRLPGSTLGDVVPRLRCSKCRAPPAQVRLANVHHGMITPVIEVVLLP